jgi:broad specificity phosphatase PhoE
MSKVYIVRHGQNIDNLNGILNGHRDLSLTDLGITQAKNLAQNLLENNFKPDLILSSPLRRCVETANEISKILGVDKPMVEPLLIERDFGSMTGKRTDEIDTICGPDIIKSPTITYFLNPEGAETFSDLLKRSEIFLNKLEKDFSGKEKILCVTHGDIGKMIYTKFYDLDWKDVLLNFHFGNSEMLALEKGAEESERFHFKQEQYNH